MKMISLTDFKKLHEAHFKKMESIDSYVQRKTKQMDTYRSSAKELKVCKSFQTVFSEFKNIKCYICKYKVFICNFNSLFFPSNFPTKLNCRKLMARIKR